MHKSISGDNSPINTVLKVSASQKKLTKNQLTFNRLTARIAKLRQELAIDGARLVQLSSIYNAEIAPLVKDLAIEKIILAKKLAAVHTTIKLTEKQIEEVGQLIFDLLDDAFAAVPPDEEAKKLYDSIAVLSYEDALKKEKATLKDDVREHLYDTFGVDIDMDNFDDSADGYAQFREKLQEQIEQHRQKQGQKKKTKKQLAKEAGLQQQEAVKKRTMRSIYMSLVKLLHPDTEINEILKKEKEEVMKQLTRAYNDNDLTALLKLEVQWIATENDHLEKLTDDTLKIYIAVLNGQVKELEMEKAMQMNNPAFETVLHCFDLDTTAAIAHIKYEKEIRAGYIEQMKNRSVALDGGKLRAAIRDCIDAYLKDDADGLNDDDDMQSFHEMMEMLMRRKK